MSASSRRPFPGRLFRSALVLGAFVSALRGGAQTAPAPAAAADPDVVQLEKFATTGTRFAGRTVTGSSVPVDVLTAVDLQGGGYTETNQLLQSLIPSFNFPRPAILDVTSQVRPATVRNLSPDQVLVLINGKRRHPSAAVNVVSGGIGKGSQSVDLNAIPPDAIERIEVLRDGASAQYGSDAIAGVINIILRHDQAFEVRSTVGETKEGDGRVWEVSAHGGARVGRKGSLGVTLYHRDRDSTDRSNPDLRRLQYFVRRDADNALLYVSGTFANGQLVRPEGTYTVTPAGVFTAPAGYTLDLRESTIDRAHQPFGDGSSQERGVFVDFDQPLDGHLTFYAFGGFSRRDGRSGAFWRRPIDDRTVRAIYPDGFRPELVVAQEDPSLSAGVRGEFSDYSYDFSNTFGRSRLDIDVDKDNNASLGAASPTHFYAGRLSNVQDTLNLDVKRAFGNQSHPVNVAFGAEWRFDGYKIGAGEPNSYLNGGQKVLDGPRAGNATAAGDTSFPGFRPTDAVDVDRHSIAGYLELESNLTDRWTVDLAGRYEDYSDFGSTVDGKASTRFDLGGGLAARASVSTGFHAPSLGQQWYTATTTGPIPGLGIADIRTVPVSSTIGRALGATDLKPETSVNYSGGFAFSPTPAFSITLDAYQIEVSDRIVLSGGFYGPLVTSLLNAAGFVSPNTQYVNYFTNAVDTRTRGLDATARYRFDPTPASHLVLTAGLNTNRTRITREKSPPAGLGSYLDRAERGRIEEAAPQLNLNASATYSFKRATVFVREVRYGPVVSRSSNGSAFDQTFGAKWVTDLEFAWRFGRIVSASVGANNLFDVYPDQVRPENNADGQLPYGGISPFGYSGAFYYAKLNLKL